MRLPKPTACWSAASHEARAARARILPVHTGAGRCADGAGPAVPPSSFQNPTASASSLWRPALLGLLAKYSEPKRWSSRVQPTTPSEESLQEALDELSGAFGATRRAGGVGGTARDVGIRRMA